MSVETYYYNGKNGEGLWALIRSLIKGKLYRFRIDEYDEKTRLQEEKAHAMLGDIARQAKHLNRMFDVDSWKRLTVAQFRIDCIENNVERLADYWRKQKVELVPSLDGSALVTLGAQTRDFPKYVYAGWITWLYAYGDNLDPPIKWSEPVTQWDERFAA
jgi:hypothetical protein